MQDIKQLTKVCCEFKDKVDLPKLVIFIDRSLKLVYKISDDLMLVLWCIYISLNVCFKPEQLTTHL